MITHLIISVWSWRNAISRNRLRRLPIKLILIRHGETRWNNQRRIQGGSSDTVLSPTGKKQVKSLGLALKAEELSAIYSSPLQRALETAQAIARYHKHLKVQVEPELRELEVGDLEGATVESLGVDFSQFLLRWRDGEGAEKLPGGGESLVDLRNRAWSVTKRIVSDRQGTVVLVSHYFVTVSIICAALGLPPKGIRRFRVGVGSMSVLDFRNGLPCLISLGDVCHLGKVTGH
jgi:broad specificity phosphatase PhoE